MRLILLIFAAAALLSSCANDMVDVNRFIDVETEPDVIGENVEVLMSDSARLQVRMVTTLMKQFNTAKEMRDEYPEGLHVWFYDASGELNGEMTANWALYDKVAEMWEARSNVVLTSADGRVLETEQFFWDRRKQIVFSEKFTKITDPDGSIATVNSFTANQDFSDLRLMRGRATIIMREDLENDDDSETEDQSQEPIEIQSQEPVEVQNQEPVEIQRQEIIEEEE